MIMAARWTALMAVLAGVMLTGCSATYLELCNRQALLTDGQDLNVVTKPEWYPLDQCSCSITPTNNITSKTILILEFTFTTPNKSDASNQSCSPVVRVSQTGRNFAYHACAHTSQKFPYRTVEQLNIKLENRTEQEEMGPSVTTTTSVTQLVTVADVLTFDVINQRKWHVNLTLNVKAQGGPAQVTCREKEVSLRTRSCPCSGLMPPKGGMEFGHDVPLKTRLTAGLVSAFIFLILVGIAVALYYFCWKKRGRDAKGLEKVTPPEVGSENKAYQNSHVNVNDGMHADTKNKDGKGKMAFTPDPDLNLNLATPSSSMTNESFVPHRGSTDSGLYSMPGAPRGNNGESPYVRANSMDQLNRSQPDIAGRPDIMGAKKEGQGPGSRANSIDQLNRSQPDIAGRPHMHGPGQDRRPVQLSPAELEDLYAKPNKGHKTPTGYRTPPQPNGPPPPGPLAHSQPRMGSYEQLNRPYHPVGTSQDRINRSYNGLASSRDGMNRSYNGSSNELYATDDSHNRSVETDV